MKQSPSILRSQVWKGKCTLAGEREREFVCKHLSSKSSPLPPCQGAELKVPPTGEWVGSVVC